MAATVVFLLDAPLLGSYSDLDALIYKGCANQIFRGGALLLTIAILSSGLSPHASSTKFYKTSPRPRWASRPRSSSYYSAAGTSPAPTASSTPCRRGASYSTPPSATFFPSPSLIPSLPLLSHRCATPSSASHMRHPWMPRQSSSACSTAADLPHPWSAWAGEGRRGWVWRLWRTESLPPSSSGGHGFVGFCASSISVGLRRADGAAVPGCRPWPRTRRWVVPRAAPMAHEAGFPRSHADGAVRVGLPAIAACRCRAGRGSPSLFFF